MNKCISSISTESPPHTHTHTFHCYLIAGGRHHLQTFYDSQSHCVIVSFADASPFFWVSLYDIEHLPQKWTVIHLYEMIGIFTFDVLAQPLWWLWCCLLWSLHRADIGAGLVDAATCVWLEICTIVWLQRGNKHFRNSICYSYSRKVRNNCGTLEESINFGKEHVARVPIRLLQPSQGSRSAVKQ